MIYKTCHFIEKIIRSPEVQRHLRRDPSMIRMLSRCFREPNLRSSAIDSAHSKHWVWSETFENMKHEILLPGGEGVPLAHHWVNNGWCPLTYGILNATCSWMRLRIVFCGMKRTFGLLTRSLPHVADGITVCAVSSSLACRIYRCILDFLSVWCSNCYSILLSKCF